MRNLLIVSALILFTGIACDHTSKPVPVDINAEEAVINDVIDNLYTAMKEQDVSNMAAPLSEDALICGSDPSEFWTKQEIIDEWSQTLTDSVTEFEFIGDRRIIVAPDGKSATAVDQIIFPGISLPWRFAYQFIKTDDNWKIFFLNIAVLPKNEDLAKIDEVVK